MGATRTAGVAEAQGYIIGFTNIEQPVIVFVERIFLIVHFHPGKEQRSAAGYDIRQTRIVFNTLRRFLIHTAVNGHKVYAVFGMLFNNFKKLIYRNIF